MKNRGFQHKTRVVVAGLTAALILHFTFTAIYVTPNHYYPNWVNRVVGSYMSPVFHQAWHLFAPNPPLKAKTMQYRVFYDGQWQEWVDSERQLLAAHDRWRLGNANIRYRIHQNTAHRLWDEQERAETIREYKSDDFNRRDYLLGSGGYLTALHFCRQLASQSRRQAEPDSIQMRLIISTPPEPNEPKSPWQRDTLIYPASHGVE